MFDDIIKDLTQKYGETAKNQLDILNSKLNLLLLSLYIGLNENDKIFMNEKLTDLQINNEADYKDLQELFKEYGDL